MAVVSAGSFFCWFYHCNEGWNVWHLHILASCFSKYLPERWKISGQTNSNLRSIMPLYIHFTCLQITVCGHLDIIKVLQKHKICQDNITKITCHIGNFWIWHFETLKEKSDIFFSFSFGSLDSLFLSSLNFCEFIYW